MNIFFDLDGTLIDISEKYYNAHTKALKKLHKSPLKFIEYWTLKKNKIAEEIILNMDSKSKLFQLYEHERIKLLEEKTSLDLDKPFYGVNELLYSLSNKYTLYVITMRRNKKNLSYQINNLTFAKFFKAILSNFSSEDSVLTKTNLIKTTDFKEGDLICGDTEVEIEVARKLKLTSISVYSGIRSKEFLKKYQPDFLISNAYRYFKP